MNKQTTLKRKFKTVLDVIMILMMLTFYNKRLISMNYHEVAGLILIALVIIHIVINGKMIAAMSKNFIKIPGTAKAGLIVDILLIICFVWLGISGIFSSHTILTQISSDNMIFKLGHMFAGGLSVILLGVHIGLHICRKPMPVTAAVVITLIALCGSIYGMANSSEGRWLTIPFTTMVQQNNQQGTTGRETAAAGGGNSQGGGEKTAQNNQQSENAQNAGKPGKNAQPLSWAQRFESVLMFLTMILLCAMITYWIAVPKKKNENKKVLVLKM